MSNVEQFKLRHVLTSADLTREQIERGLQIAEEVADLINNAGAPMTEEYLAPALLQVADDQYIRLMAATRADLALALQYMETQLQETNALVEQLRRHSAAGRTH